MDMENYNQEQIEKRPNNDFIMTVGNKLSISLLLILATLLPLFFLPFLSSSSLIQTKNIFFIITISLAVIFWLIDILMIGRISFPHHKLFYLTLYLPVFFVIPLIFSGSFLRSLIGAGQQYDTFIFIIGLLSSFVLFGLLFQGRKKQLNFYFLFLLVGIISAVYQLLRFSLAAFWPGFFVWNYLPVSLLGGWLESGAYFGLNLLLLIFFWKFIGFNSFPKTIKYLVWLGFVVFIANLILINFYIVWILLLISSIIFLFLSLKEYYSKLEDQNLSFSNDNYPAIILLAVATLFTLFGNKGGWLYDGILKLYSLASFSFLDFRPGFFYTWQTYMNMLQEDITYGLFGAGLNNFYYAWNNWRPIEVALLDNFWLFSFNGGNSILMSFLITSGLVGFLALLVWLLVISYYTLKNIILSKNVSREDLVLSGFWLLGFGYLWFFNIFYFYRGVLWIFSFIFAGLLASVIFTNSRKVRFDFSNRPELRTIITFVGFLLIITFGFVSFVFSKHLVASYNFEMGVKSFSAGNLLEVEEYLNRAVSYSRQPEYYNSLSESSLYQLDKRLAESLTEGGERYKGDIKSDLEKPVFYAQRAVRFGKNNYNYHISLGKAYEKITLLSLGAEDTNIGREAYSLAKESYETAISLAKTRPEIYLELARLELTVGNIEVAKGIIEKAIEIKPNYHQAYIWLAQVLDRQGKLDKAVDAANRSLNIDPNDQSGYFIAGYLQYRLNDYLKAIELLDRSMELSGGFNANSAYYLGLSYDRLGRRREALELFEKLLAENPQNKELESIVRNIRAGRSALSNVSEVNPELIEKVDDVKEDEELDEEGR